MNVTMLGTGTGIIRPERRSPAVLIQTADHDSAIVDCGWGVPEALNRLQFPLHTLGHLCITHSHADHMSAVPALLQSTLISNIAHLPGNARDTKLTIHGYPGIKQDINTLAEIMVPELDVAKELNIIEYGKQEKHLLGSFAILATPVKHVPALEAVAYSFEADNKKAVVSGDLGWDESILPLLQDADIAIMDSSASQAEQDENPNRSHLSPRQCGILASRANVKHLVLTSLYDRETPQDIKKAVRDNYQGELTIPKDFQVFRF